MPSKTDVRRIPVALPFHQPWRQLPRESDIAYQCFLIYRGMAPKRSQERAFIELQRRKGGASVAQKAYIRPGGISDWAIRYRWAERCRAWAEHVRAELDRIQIDEYKKWEK